MLTDRHTERQTDYRNPLAHARCGLVTTDESENVPEVAVGEGLNYETTNEGSLRHGAVVAHV